MAATRNRKSGNDTRGTSDEGAGRPHNGGTGNGGTRPPPHDADWFVRHLRRTRFRYMHRSVLRQLVEHVLRNDRDAELTLTEGTALFEPGTPADAMYIVIRGALEERSPAGSLLWELGPGDVVGEIELFAEHPDGKHESARHRSRVVCTERADVLAIRQSAAEELVVGRPDVRPEDSFALTVVRGLATDALLGIQRRAEADEVARSYFDGRTARLVPGPYECRDVEMFVTFAQTSDGTYGPYLPEGVHPLPFLRGGLFLLVFAHFASLRQPAHPNAAPFCYDEAALFVPVWTTGGAYAYVPALYPDSFMAVTLGREIYGFRKRNAETTIDPERGRLDLHLDGEHVARARFAERPFDAALLAKTVGGLFADPLRALADVAAPHVLPPLAKALGPVPAWLDANLTEEGILRLAKGFLGLAAHAPLEGGLLRGDVPVLNLKQIPAPGHTAHETNYEVNELCLSPFRMRRLTALRLLDVSELRLSGRIPFEGAQLASPVGVYARCDFDLRTGSVVKRYKPNVEPLRA